jgi:hypothetical protein
LRGAKKELDSLAALCDTRGMQGQERCWHVQGRDVNDSDLEWIRGYRQAHPEARRKRIAIALCEHWGWRNGRGHLKEMAARALLNRLADQGVVELPPLRQWIRRNEAVGRAAAPVPAAGEAIKGALSSLQPLNVRLVEDGDGHDRWAGYLRGYHYLGLSIVGENIGYLIGDRNGRDLGALLFGAAAWRCAARDRYIGWTDRQRRAGLSGIANNTRFLILPWVGVPHLASHVLGTIQRRISADWQRKYGHGLQWLETFVDTGRFNGTCYRAASWRQVGVTCGRTRQDREHRVQVNVKYVLFYALDRQRRSAP